MVSSEDHAATVRTNRNNAKTAMTDLVVEVGESLRLVATLYRTSPNKYQDKNGKLVVRRRHSGDKVKNTNAYKGIGVVKLSLSSLAGSFDPQRITAPLEQCSTSGAVINIVVTAKFLGEGGEDTMSQMSGMSDVSCDVADFGDAFGASGAVSSGPIPENLLGGITEETDHDLSGEMERSPRMTLAEPEERPTEIFDRLITTADASKIGVSNNSGFSSDIDEESKATPIHKMDVPMDPCSSDRDNDSRETFSMNTNMPFISQAAYDDKINEIRRLRNQLDQYTADLSRTESKLSTANLLVSAETKRSKKLKAELIESRKHCEEQSHTILLLEKQKGIMESKVKHLETEISRARLLVDTQKLLTEAVTERQEASQEVIKGMVDEKVELVTLKDEVEELRNDRDVYKAELMDVRAENAYLREDLGSRGIEIPPPDERYEEDKSDIISALRSQLGSLQILADEEKVTFTAKLEAYEGKIEKIKVQAVARETELKTAGVQALAVAKKGWDTERAVLETRLGSSENDVKEMLQEIAGYRNKLKEYENKIQFLEVERNPSPPPAPSRSTDSPAPMLKQLSRMKSIKASFAGSSKNITAGTESDEAEKQIESLVSSHQNELAILTKELDSLRTKNALLESELDSADQRFEATEHELKLTKLELWETLDKVDTKAKSVPERRESLRPGPTNIPSIDANSALLDQLITLKLEHATLANARDNERLETFDLKKRLQSYAQRVASLEVEVALDREANKA